MDPIEFQGILLQLNPNMTQQSIAQFLGPWLPLLTPSQLGMVNSTISTIEQTRIQTQEAVSAAAEAGTTTSGSGGGDTPVRRGVSTGVGKDAMGDSAAVGSSPAGGAAVSTAPKPAATPAATIPPGTTSPGGAAGQAKYNTTEPGPVFKPPGAATPVVVPTTQFKGGVAPSWLAGAMAGKSVSAGATAATPAATAPAATPAPIPQPTTLPISPNTTGAAGSTPAASGPGAGEIEGSDREGNPGYFNIATGAFRRK